MGLFAIFSLICLVWLVVALVSGNRSAALTRGATALLFAVPVVWFVVKRHTGPWRAFQKKLVAFEAEAQGILQRCDHNRECAVYELDRRYESTTFQFTPEHRPVRLYLRSGEPPLVGVDFGGGANAVFDSTWMITTHLD